MSNIEWTGKTWNPTNGCTKTSPGCKHCYAETMAKRLQAMGTHGYENGFAVSLMTERLEIPLQRKKPTLYFTNSMGDLFHPDVPFDYIDNVLNVMYQTPQHTYQTLTKFPERMKEWWQHRKQQFFNPGIPPHLPLWTFWGVSVENKKHGIPRIDMLKDICGKKFLSCEPLLEDIAPALDLTGIDWVIVGGESGSKARPMHPQWVRNIRDLCQESDVPFFFKQWGTWASCYQVKIPADHPARKKPHHDGAELTDGEILHSDVMFKIGKKQAGHLLDGVEYHQMPY
jgi:protein gp37